MTHPNDDDLKKTPPEDKSEGENSESLSFSSETDAIPEKDAFFTGNTVKKKISPLFMLIIMAFVVIACLVFGYIYNIGNMRDVGQKYSFPPSSLEKLPNDEVRKIQLDIIKPEESSTKSLKETKKDKADITATLTEIPLQRGLKRKDYIDYHHAIYNLNDKIDNSDRYLDELVTVKTFFPILKLPVMTRYSNSSMPSKIEIVIEGMKALRRAATLPNISAEQDFAEKFSNIIKYFVVITPTRTTNVNEHDGRFALLKQALKKGDLPQIMTLIATLHKSEQAEFRKTKRYIEDYFALQTEKKYIQDALLEKLYPSDKGKETL